MVSRRLLVSLALGAAAIIQCTSTSNPTSAGSNSPGAAYAKVMTISYSTSGTHSIKTITVSDTCNGSTLVTAYDTSMGIYSVTADSLYVIDTTGGTNDTQAHAQRVGSGTGLVGTWQESEDNPLTGASITGLYVVSSTTVEEWALKTDIIDILKIEMLAADPTGAIFSGVTIDTSVAGRFGFTGKTTHEVVTITVADNGAFVWSSSNPAHATQSINSMSGPSSCPDNGLESIPTWYVDFITANPGTTAKILALPAPHLSLKLLKW